MKLARRAGVKVRCGKLLFLLGFFGNCGPSFR
jgi:hypothetical protein